MNELRSSHWNSNDQEKSFTMKKTKQDFEQFDYIIAMDQSNRQNLLQFSNEEQRQKIFMFRQFEEGMDSQSDVPDPYYGGSSGFDNVLDICERGCDGLIEFLKQQL